MDSNYSSGLLRVHLLPLFLLSGLFFFQVFARSIFSPLLIPMQEEFSISHADTSYFFLIISAGYTVTILLSGFISNRIMHRRTIILSGVLTAVGMLIIGAAPTLWIVYMGLAILGSGAGLYPPSGLSVITDMVQRENWQKALTIHELGPNLAMVAVPFFAAAMMTKYTWRSVMIAAGAAMLLLVLFFQIKVVHGNAGGEKPTWVNIRALIVLPSFWVMTLLYGLALSSILGVYFLIPTYLVAEAGFTLREANFLFGTSRFFPIPALLTAGMVLQRFGERFTMLIVLFLSGITVVLLGAMSGPLLVIIIFLQPTIVALFFPAGVSAISMIGPPRVRNVAFSLLLPFASFLGAGVIPAYIAYMGEYVSFSSGFIVVGILISICSFITLLLPLKAKKR